MEQGQDGQHIRTEVDAFGVCVESFGELIDRTGNWADWVLRD